MSSLFARESPIRDEATAIAVASVNGRQSLLPGCRLSPRMRGDIHAFDVTEILFHTKNELNIFVTR